VTSNKTKLTIKATVSPAIIFDIFYVCSLEDAACSELEDKKTIEHYMLLQCETEHKHIRSKNRGSKNFKHKAILY
jgi:hypothetical protein